MAGATARGWQFLGPANSLRGPSHDPDVAPTCGRSLTEWSLTPWCRSAFAQPLSLGARQLERARGAPQQAARLDRGRTPLAQRVVAGAQAPRRVAICCPAAVATGVRH